MLAKLKAQRVETARRITRCETMLLRGESTFGEAVTRRIVSNYRIELDGLDEQIKQLEAATC